MKQISGIEEKEENRMRFNQDYNSSIKVFGVPYLKSIFKNFDLNFRATLKVHYQTPKHRSRAYEERLLRLYPDQPQLLQSILNQ